MHLSNLKCEVLLYEGETYLNLDLAIYIFTWVKYF